MPPEQQGRAPDLTVRFSACAGHAPAPKIQRFSSISGGEPRAAYTVLMQHLTHLRPASWRKIGRGAAGLWLGLLGALAWSAQAQEADTAGLWEGPRGPYVFVQAEDFTTLGEGWEVVNASRHFEAPFISNMKDLAGNSAGSGVATHELQVPEAGRYFVWVRFAQLPKATSGLRAPFALQLEQAGRPVFQQEYDRKLERTGAGGNAVWARYEWVVSRHEQDPNANTPKLPGAGKGKSGGRGGDEVDFSLEEPAADAEEKFPDGRYRVALKAGPLKLTLSKREPLAANGNIRRIDCLLLTTDSKYVPEHRDFAPQTYVRLRLLDCDPGDVYFYTFLNHMREPWYRNISFDRAGLHLKHFTGSTDRLNPGDTTPWANVSRLLYDGWPTIFNFHAQITYGQSRADRAVYEIDFAAAPREDAIVKTIRREGEGNGIAVLVPENMAEGRRPMADYQIASETSALTTRLPAVPFGRRAQRFPLLTDISVSGSSISPGTAANELAAAQWMGLSGDAGLPTAAGVAAGLRFGRTGASIWHMGPGGFNEPDLETIEQRTRDAGGKLKANPPPGEITQVKLMDEASGTGLDKMMQSKADQTVFRQWVQEQGYTAMDLGALGMDEVNLTDQRDHAEPLLYLLSRRFQAWTVARFFKLASDAVHRHFPAGLKTTQNFSDYAVYMGNTFAAGVDYYEFFTRQQALDIAMSEDWTNLGATHEMCGWNVALLRAAARKHGQPVHMYCITSYGRRPLDIKLKAYSDIAEGAKLLNFYAYQPIYAGHERGWYRQWERYAAVAEAAHEIGAAEDVLIDALPRPAAAAILHSTTADLWAAGYDTVQSHERTFTWLALKHGQTAVDVISEAEVLEGALAQRRVVYCVGEHLDARCVPPLVAWVKQGGTLVLAPYAVSRDELNQPLKTLDEGLQLGRADGPEQWRYVHSSRYVMKAFKAAGAVTLANPAPGSVPYGFLRQNSAPAGEVEVLARFADDAPAALRIKRGAGQVYLFGFAPGTSYMYESWRQLEDELEQPVRQLAFVEQVLRVANEDDIAAQPSPLMVPRKAYSTCPYRYPAALGQLICLPPQSAGVVEPVQVDTRQVEARFMESNVGFVIPLANYTGSALAQITVTLRPGQAHGVLHSSRLGALKPTVATDGTLTVTLPLESTDMLYAPWNARP